MRILVTGASGLVGAALVPALTAAGHRVTRLVRVRPRDPDESRWDPGSGLLDPAALTDCEAVIHLAGEGIAAGRW
ncbi:MAG: NAD-dependent epimerase/dehydratase family protein, partial [Candidatus Eisenbacteria bacterium]